MSFGADFVTFVRSHSTSKADCYPFLQRKSFRDGDLSLWFDRGQVWRGTRELFRRDAIKILTPTFLRFKLPVD